MWLALLPRLVCIILSSTASELAPKEHPRAIDRLSASECDRLCLLRKFPATHITEYIDDVSATSVHVDTCAVCKHLRTPLLSRHPGSICRKTPITCNTHSANHGPRFRWPCRVLVCYHVVPILRQTLGLAFRSITQTRGSFRRATNTTSELVDHGGRPVRRGECHGSARV